MSTRPGPLPVAASWVRGCGVTVHELLGLSSGERLDRPEPVPPMVDAQTYLTLVTVANALGELVARANAEQRYPAEGASAVYDQVRQAVVEIRRSDRHGHGTGPA